VGPTLVATSPKQPSPEHAVNAAAAGTTTWSRQAAFLIKTARIAPNQAVAAAKSAINGTLNARENNQHPELEGQSYSRSSASISQKYKLNS
jgi:hypothetical protein